MQITAVLFEKHSCGVEVKSTRMAIAPLRTSDTITPAPRVAAVLLSLADDMVSAGEINFPWEYTSYLP